MKSSPKSRTAIRLGQIVSASLFIFLIACVPAAAQLSPTEPDPLARIREAAKTNVQACSATGATLCEQVAPKIIANVQGDSPLAESFRSLVKALKSQKAAPGDAPAVAWALAAFRDAGVEAHVEKYLVAAGEAEGALQNKLVAAEIVVAEIRGREKPDEWVLLGGSLHSSDPSGAADAACNGALVVEAARDIQLTDTHPRRSIRFVLFGGEDQGMTGSWAYVKGHRNELDRAPAAILFEVAANHVDGFALNGRRDIEPGVREALKPIESMGVTNLRFDAPFEIDSLDFLLEGVPTLVAATGGNHVKAGPNTPNSADAINLNELKRNTAIAAVTAFGAAERAEPVGSRQSRTEIASLLKATNLEDQMKTGGVWSLWESGKRGHLP
jgi:hypothetical protein